jgi:hypothetical protein
MPLPLALALAPTIAKTGFGIFQAFKGGNKLKGLERPIYQIPDELRQNVGVAERMATQGIGGTQKQEYQQALDRSSQFSLRGLSDRRAGIGAVTGVQNQLNTGAQRLMSMDDQARLRNQQLAISARERLALAKDQAFQLNQLQPYMDKRSEGQALIGAGIQNIAGGLDSASGNFQADLFGGGSGFTGGNNISQRFGMTPPPSAGFGGFGYANQYAPQGYGLNRIPDYQIRR